MKILTHPKGLREEMRNGYRIKYLAGTPSGRYSQAWWRLSTSFVEKLVEQRGVDLILSLSLAGYGVATSRIKSLHYVFVSGKTLDHLLNDLKTLADLKGLIAFPKHALTLCYYAMLERRLWSRVDGLIAKDDLLYQDLLSRGWRVFLFYNGTDIRSFQPDPIRREATRHALGIDPQAKVLLMVATVNRQKGVWVGVEAFYQLAPSYNDLHLVVVGDGPDRLRLQANLGKKPFSHLVHWIGTVPPAETAVYFAAADLLLYPTFRMEGLPNAIIEAMSAGLPVVATDRGGVRSAVRPGETGLLLTAPAVDEVVESIRALLEDPRQMSSMGQRARKRALECFDAKVLVDRLLYTLTGEI
jgi:glycosyltransferase involved in cell wall biosynthesis